MIRIDHVSKRFGQRVALDDVSLEIEAGVVTLLLGPNGAGKSTLLRSILGIAEAEGRIRVNGLDPFEDGAAVRSLIGYMPQNGGLHGDLTAAETLRFHAALRRVPIARAQALAVEAGLDGHQHTKVRDLSGGMRQRLGFAIALLSDPPILILDEPGSSLDAASREWVAARLRSLARSGHAVLVSTHDGQELTAAGDRRIVLENGRVVVSEAITPRQAPVSVEADAVRIGSRSGRMVRAATALREFASSAAPIVKKELLDGIRHRWLVGYTVLLGVLGFAAAAAGLDASAGLALQTFGRTTATLMNLCLLLAPIVAVLIGASSIAGEQDQGTLELLLAQPITRSQLLVAKYVGLLASLSLATLAGFIPAGAFIVHESGATYLGYYLLFPAIAVVLGAAMLGLGFLISVSSRTGAQAQATAVFLWFSLVLLYDLLVMGTLALGGMPIQMIASTLVVNPVDAARVLGVLSLEPDLYLLGPAGAYLAVQFTRAGAALLLISSLASWIVVPLTVALWRFRVRRARSAGPSFIQSSPTAIIRTEEAPSS